MIYTKQTKLAMQIAFSAHLNQKDKTGLPYIFHPIIVANDMDDELSTTVALLHDLLEDTPYTEKDLLDLGIDKKAVETIRVMTKQKGENYEDYVLRVKQNEIAKKVKLADLKHNTNLSRLDNVTERDIARTEKYKNAIKLLTE